MLRVKICDVVPELKSSCSVPVESLKSVMPYFVVEVHISAFAFRGSQDQSSSGQSSGHAELREGCEFLVGFRGSKISA